MILSHILQFADSISLAPLPHVTAGNGILQKVLSVVFEILGAISLLVITIAGFRFIVSRGDPQRVSQARAAILYALVGLVVAISGATIVTFVINKT